jgi:hypothetical protein
METMIGIVLTFLGVWVLVVVVRNVVSFFVGVRHGVTYSDNDLLLWLYKERMTHTQVAWLLTGFIWLAVWMFG